jgi:hypothetical protein
MNAAQRLASVMKDFEIRAPDNFLFPPGSESESRGEQYKAVDFRVQSGIKSSEVSAHAGADQSRGCAAQSPFNERKLAGNGEMLKIALLQSGNFKINAPGRKSHLECARFPGLRTGSKSMGVKKSHAIQFTLFS